MKTALYDVLVDGVIVYVGISNKPDKRLREHKAKRTVPKHAVVQVVRWYETQWDARQAETVRIRLLKPPANIDLLIPRSSTKAKFDREFAAWEAHSMRNKASYDRAIQEIVDAGWDGL